MASNDFLLTSTNLDLFPSSLVSHHGLEFALHRVAKGRQIVVLGLSEKMGDFVGEFSEHAGKTLFIGNCNQHNAYELGNHLEWLKPSLLGLCTSAGMGDRLGLATPGHVQAVRACGEKITPIFAQQSIRELSRTRRTPHDVMADATWGMFQEGWKGPCGADADHLKTREDIDICLAAGYTFFTIDPGGYVNNRAENLDINGLRQIVETMPEEMHPVQTGLLNKKIDLEGLKLFLNEFTLLKAIVKYGQAICHVVRLYRHLLNTVQEGLFELEISVDETDLPTSHAEHYYIASELKRQGVKWVSLAPRFIGRFEKGVDYIGDPTDFEKDIAGHAAISRVMGPYKLSLHSGSDKFSIYEPAMHQTQGLIHLKTAGTSYLEALRTIAETDPMLFQEIYEFAREKYEVDRTSYHVSAELMRAPMSEKVSDWTSILEQFDAREILHVTFGSVLTEVLPAGQSRFKDRIMANLDVNSVLYAENIKKHFIRHLSPFCRVEK